MATIVDIQNFLGSYVNRTAIADLNPTNLTPAGINVDLGLMAINNARRTAERLRDWKLSEVTAYLSVPSTGGALTACHLVVNLGDTAFSVKSVQTVGLPISGGAYQPVEFMTEDAFTNRIRSQIGRAPYDAALTLAQLGVSNPNPLAYQRGQSIYLSPITATTTVQLGATRWLADYTTGADSDWFTLYAPEYLGWAALVELNRLYKVFIPKTDTNIDEASIITERDRTLESILAWDDSMKSGTSTPPSKG